MTSVTIIQRVLPHYRVPFFESLAERLAHDGIRLKLIYGQEYPGTVPKSVNLQVEWARKIKNLYLKSSEFELVWQPCLDELADSDLLVVEQANRLLLNYVLQFRRRSKGHRLAYWGHGRNMQSGDPRSWRERFKRRVTLNADWWFAYTRMSAEAVAACGFPKDKITIVQNAVDTHEIVHGMRAVTPEKLDELRSSLDIDADNVCLYCGGMHPDKKLDFLVEACKRVKSLVPDFRMIFIGDGPEQYKVEQAAREHSWVHYVGPKYGADRLPYFMISRAMLMPGLVGLAIVDCFAAGIPIITTDIPIHSPEIAYLENNVNGIMTAYSMESYVPAVVEYLRSPPLQACLKSGCVHSASDYTLDNMVENFAAGVERCLAQ